MGRMQRDAVFGSIPAAGGIHCSKKGECAMTDRPRPARRRRTPPPPRGKREQPASRSWDRRLAQLAGAQAVLGCFNLLPILPLDGGRMLWLALCWGTDPFLADRVAQAVSLAAAGLLTVAGAALARRSPFLLWTAAALLVCAAAPCIKRRRSVYASHKGR